VSVRPITKAFEVAFARSLLKYMHGNVNNIYLLLAVIAWVRSESGTHYIGNNPLNLRPGADDAKYRSGIRQGRVGKFSVYVTLDAGAHATANRLLRAGNDYRGYGLVIRAAQRHSGDSAKDQQQQALDFLNALALSKWDAGHYGTSGNPATFDQSKNNLVKVWARLLGHPVVIPNDPAPSAKPKPKPKPPKPPPAPKQPRAVEHVVPKRDYLDGYAQKNWYEERHAPLPNVPGDPATALG
jgi:hypothetical protein